MSRQDTEELLGLIFEQINIHFFDAPLTKKSDLAMDIYGIFYQWANPHVDINDGEIEVSD